MDAEYNQGGQEPAGRGAAWVGDGPRAAARLVATQRLLSREDEQDLAQRIELGDGAARRQFIEANLRLVLSIARHYQGYGVPLSDLVQEGNIGLIQAVDHFDWRKGTRFSTCATLWIKQAIIRALPGLRHPIRIPPRVLRDAGLMESTIEQLTQQLQRQPSSREIEAHLARTIGDVDDLRKLPLDAVSIDTQMEEYGRPSLGDGLIDPDTVDPADETVNALAERALLAAFHCLLERERQVLALRFGLAGQREHTLGEIGDLLRLSRQRVKQIETSALRKLRQQVLRDRQDLPKSA